MLITSWLPDVTPVLRLRGFLARPAFKKCGRNLQIAKHVHVNFTSRIELGRDVFLAYSCWIQGSGGLTIGDGVLLSPFAVVATGNHGKRDGSYRWAKGRNDPIVIGDGAWISSHAVVTTGCRVGRGALVASNSVVLEDVPDDCVVGGVPAKVVRENVGDFAGMPNGK